MNPKKAIIIGAGPAGLTAAYELLDKTDILPVIFEATPDIGGISKTVNYKGNRIDIGGHRFFSKSDTVMSWWQNILSLQGRPSKDDILLDRKLSMSEKCIKKSLKSNSTVETNAPNPEIDDDVMLIRNRVSRIYFLRSFFDYPVSLNFKTVKNLGIIRLIRAGFSYIYSCLFPLKNEKNLQDFFINRFGKELYETFFKDYTEKVWGVPCDKIKPDWGAQRIKGLSITKALLHSFKKIFVKDISINQKNLETSLINQFLYPKFGPGHLWEKVAEIVTENHGQIFLNYKIVKINTSGDKITGVLTKNQLTGEEISVEGDYFISTMPVKELINSLNTDIPTEIKETANGLVYRDFKTVGMLLEKLKINNETKIKTLNNLVPDNWIYIQERDVNVGRLQIFNNWSPYMLNDLNKVWIGLEYFCNEGDFLWEMPDAEFIEFAKNELEKIDIINKQDVLDAVVISVPKAYPAYFGTYDKFLIVKDFVNKYENLYLVGRNGMHRYNNMDHSMLSAMQAVHNIINNVKSKDNIWNVNAEEEYHEEK